MTRKIAVILGVGAEQGLGAALCRKAAAADFHVVAAGRTQSRLEETASRLREAGGSAEAFAVDVTEEDQVIALFEHVAGLDGQLDLVVYNVGNAFMHDTLTMPASLFEKAWRVCCYGGFLVGREAGKLLSAQGSGSLFFSGATASVRSRPPFIAFAAGKAGLRAVASGLAREFGPKGVHVAHVILDGAIDGDQLNSRMPQAKAHLGEDGMLDPDVIADNYLWLHGQQRSAWTFEVDLRPFKENF